MLSNTNMLVPEGEGRRQRARGTCYVDTPPYGFFIAGSSVKKMNGVYVRRGSAPVQAERDGEDILLYYAHHSGPWTMLLSEVRSEADDEDEGSHYRWKPEPVRQWLLVDERQNDRFTHEGSTIVPGAGVRWKHVHKQSGSSRGAGSMAWPFGLGGSAQALSRAQPDDDEELPWQVIAILDRGILQDLIHGARYHQHRIDEALAGRGDAVVAPALTSLEGAFEPGRFIYVVQAEQLEVRSAPASSARVVGTREKGAYVRGLMVKQTASDGQWLRLENPLEPVDLDELGDGFGFGGRLLRQQRGKGGGHLNAEHGLRRKEWWVCLSGADGAEPPLRRLEGADCAHLHAMRLEGEAFSAGPAPGDDEVAARPAQAEAHKGRLESSLAAEFLDAPFVPRLEGAGSTEPAEKPMTAAAAAADQPHAAEEAAAAKLGGEEEAALIAAAAAPSHAFPVGAAVRLVGLKGAGKVYNGTAAVVLTPPGAEGRQGIELLAPFSGKRISPRVAHLALAPPRAADVEEQRRLGSGGEEAARHARLLGLSLSELGLGAPGRVDGAPHADGFRVGGASAEEALAAALRAAQRDSLDDEPAAGAAHKAHAALLALLGAASARAHAPAAEPAAAAGGALAPEMLVLHGALGARAAAAARAACSTQSVREVEAGLAELEAVLRDEQDRLDARRQPESADCVLLRLALVALLLGAGRDSAAMSAALDLTDAHPAAPAALVAHARCMLRVGKRTEAEEALAAAAAPPAPVGAEGCAADAADAACGAWAREVAAVHLRAMRAAERRQEQAAELYERGHFAQAAASYAEALACLEAGARDDRHWRAALHANVASCLRRNGQPDEAVAACDRALELLPRFCRALFRRGVCLLEGARPAEAVSAFERLYRVERSWPRLQDWLLRAVAAQRRVEAGGSAAGGGRRPAARADKGGSSSGATGQAAGSEDPEAIATEHDHYVVLGITVDATDKQIKAAYRMRSLKFHPDRAGQSSTAAFQRVAKAFAVLSDPDSRAAYDQGADVKTSRDGVDSDEEEEEEHKQSLREEVLRRYYPEEFDFWPFGDPFVNKRKVQAAKARRAGSRQWHDED